ncbi:IS91 family transposase [Bradyrhizobium sp. PMVTL-01]|uniref:IS91 family transposase n=1 Tax=Bradyrhizobium sp. PMVTL-01 TaxID=3434999 RepID=UPI003F7167F3
MRRLRCEAHPLQLLSQSALAKVPGAARAQWLAERQAELLPVPYFHVVFTLPAPAGRLRSRTSGSLCHPVPLRGGELTTIAADPKHLGAQLGVTAVLHTWGQTLQHHPPSLDGTRWVACRPGFFLPVRVLSRLFRRLFLQDLQAAFAAGQLGFFGNLTHLADPAAFTQRLDQLRRTDWVVYAKPPFGGPEQVLAYLGRYTHRVAIANSRLVSLSDGKVRFAWKDYRQHSKTKLMTLDADEFILRFLLHALPDGFHRIRHYGFLANGGRNDRLALCRQLLAVRQPPPDREASTDPFAKCEIPACPHCSGIMRRIDVVPRACARDQPFRCDTS